MPKMPKKAKNIYTSRFPNSWFFRTTELVFHIKGSDWFCPFHCNDADSAKTAKNAIKLDISPYSNDRFSRTISLQFLSSSQSSAFLSRDQRQKNLWNVFCSVWHLMVGKMPKNCSKFRHILTLKVIFQALTTWVLWQRSQTTACYGGRTFHKLISFGERNESEAKFLQTSTVRISEPIFSFPCSTHVFVESSLLHHFSYKDFFPAQKLVKKLNIYSTTN